MNYLQDWDKSAYGTNGSSWPEKRAVSPQQAEAELAANGRKPLLTEFGTTATYTSELDAKAREDVTMYVFDEKLDDVIKLYDKLDRGIENARGHFGRLGLMEFGEVVKEEIKLGTRRFARRGTGATDDTVIIQSTRQRQTY